LRFEDGAATILLSPGLSLSGGEAPRVRDPSNGTRDVSSNRKSPIENRKSDPLPMLDLRSKRVMVMGLGRFGGGVGVTKFLVSRGAKVLVTDKEPAEDLKESVAKIAGLPGVEFRLGEHRESDFTAADLVVVNPAVPPTNPYVKAARDAGVPLTSEFRLLVQSLPNRLRTIGITGSAGKSTTTAMLGHILRKALGEDRVHVGGNIGGSLLGEIDKIRPDDWVVLELSSFMLEGLREDKWSPHIAVITNISPNHLDWHGSFEHYLSSKLSMLEFRTGGPAPIVGPGVYELIPPDRRRFIAAWTEPKVEIPLLVPGRHNLHNAVMAVHAATLATGQEPAELAAHLADFGGLTHRLQFVAERAGVRYFNDSKATTPEATLLALQSFPPGKVHVILGGYDKGSDLAPLARFAAQHCRAIYTIGKTGDAIASAAEAAPGSEGNDFAASTHGPSQDISACGGSAWNTSGGAEVVRCHTLDRAIAETASRVRDGDVVLLSPACASWDQFTNFESRGAAFVEAVLKYTGEGAENPKPG
jgi:UDP-N-acetylmuramoylalanine--D-glutamate ligase